MSDYDDNELLEYETESGEAADELELSRVAGPVPVCIDDPVVTVGTVPQHLTAYTIELNSGDTSQKVKELLPEDPLRVRALIMVDLPDTESVTAYGTLAITGSTTAGTAIATIAAASLPAGRYRIDAYAYMSAGSTPVSTDNLQLTIGGVHKARLMHMNVVKNSGAYQHNPGLIWYADLDGTEAVAVTNVAVEAGTSETHNVVIVATREPESACALICHSYTQARNLLGVKLRAGQPGLELTTTQQVFAAALSAVATKVQVIVERRTA